MRGRKFSKNKRAGVETSARGVEHELHDEDVSVWDGLEAALYS